MAANPTGTWDGREAAPSLPSFPISSPADSRIWRSISYVFGALVPAVVWTIVFTYTSSHPAHEARFEKNLVVWTSCVIVAIEVVALVRWLLCDHRSRVGEMVASVLFTLGGIFAALWTLFSLWGLWASLLHWKGVPFELGWIMLSPLPCVLIYFTNARIAARLAPKLVP